MAFFKSWMLATRPKTLTAALVPIVVASSLAWNEAKTFVWWVSALSLLASIFIQIGTNLVNDAIDFQKGADTEKRLGPRRVTQAGIFKAQQVLGMGTFFFVLAILCGIPLVVKGGLPILVVGLVSILMGYAYTAGPFPLAYRGLGDLFVVLFFGLIAVGGVFFLHTNLLSSSALLAGLQVGLHATVLIAINNLRDVEGDRLAQKRTLPVRFGRKFARAEIAFLCISPFGVGIYWLVNGHVAAFAAPLLMLPLAFKIAILVYKTEPSPAYNQFLAMAAILHLMSGLLISVGLFI